MKKATVLNDLMWGYSSRLSGEEYDQIKKELINHDKNLNFADSAQLAESVLRNYPQFQIMHQAYMRKRMDTISRAASIIKIIVVVYFVCSVITALYFITNSSSL